MSLILDALRRGRSKPHQGAAAPRTSQTDAVLATLGYSPWHRYSRSSRIKKRTALRLSRCSSRSWSGARSSGTRRRTPQSRVLNSHRFKCRPLGLNRAPTPGPGEPPRRAASRTLRRRVLRELVQRREASRPGHRRLWRARPQPPVSRRPRLRLPWPPRSRRPRRLFPPRPLLARPRRLWRRRRPLPPAARKPPPLPRSGDPTSRGAVGRQPPGPCRAAATADHDTEEAGCAGSQTAPAACRPARVRRSAAAAGGAAGSVSSDAEHFRLGVYYHRAGDFENALKHYRALLERNELNAEVHNNLGLLYQDKGLMDEAVNEFQRAILIDQRYVKAHNNLGVAFLHLGKLDAADAEFRAALASDPGNVESLVNLALAMKTGGRREEARETLIRGALDRSAERGLPLQPGHAVRGSRRPLAGARALSGLRAGTAPPSTRTSSPKSARGSTR